ncbi:MAG: hypothetical protein C5B57_01200 [Blastocatellia bacterium]|nr:MAG: hypothetical protein C5B57_01200 [Blastocatellia bacterium]
MAIPHKEKVMASEQRGFASMNEAEGQKAGNGKDKAASQKSPARDRTRAEIQVPGRERAPQPANNTPNKRRREQR